VVKAVKVRISVSQIEFRSSCQPVSAGVDIQLIFKVDFEAIKQEHSCLLAEVSEMRQPWVQVLPVSLGKLISIERIFGRESITEIRVQEPTVWVIVVSPYEWVYFLFVSFHTKLHEDLLELRGGNPTFSLDIN